MSFRHVVGSALQTVIGPERTSRVRRAERRVRNQVAGRLAMPASGRAAQQPGAGPAKPRWAPSDPYVPHPTPTMTRHAFLARLHEVLAPRAYLEIGVADGASLALSRCPSIGVDPGYRIVRELEADLQLVRATSDDFFARPDPVAHLQGVPIDLAFIDGMHLAEFALRDFIGVEPYLSPTGVIVLDDMLPRNALEAARDRRTHAWTGDVYKATQMLAEHRRDLIVLLANTAPTGCAVVLRPDARSTVLAKLLPTLEPYLLAPDPQDPPQGYLDRSVAVEPGRLLSAEVWRELRAHRDHADAVPQSAWDAVAEHRL